MTQTKEIVFYTKQKDWAECMEAKRFLAAHNVGYVEKDVVESREHMMELVNQFRVMSVPVLVVDGTPILGFKEDAYREALGL